MTARTAAPWLALPAAVYGAAIRGRNAWYDRRTHVRHAAVPVISVGNLAVGGTGKTPLVAWLARRLAAEGRTPAIVSRGYGGAAGHGPVLVSTGTGPRVDARICGDEPHLLARTLGGVIVIVGSNRVEGARAASEAGATVVILDDGFQHRRLARDLDVVLLDGRSPFANGRLLPAGPLREPPASLARADVVVLTRLREGDPASRALAAVRDAGYTGPIVRAGHRAAGFATASGAPHGAPERALAFCGIGDPELFRTDLEACGVRPVALRAFRDHHAYSLATLDQLRSEATREGVPLVTTDKDLSRLEAIAGASLARLPLLVLRIDTVVWDDSALMTAVRDALRSRAGKRPR